MKSDVTKLTAYLTTVGVVAVSVLISLGVLPQGMLAPAILTFMLSIFGYIVTKDEQILKEIDLIHQDHSKQGCLIREIVKVPNNGISRVRLIDDPTDYKDWIDFEKKLDAFNAPWTLASNDLFPAFKKFLNQDGFKMRVLLFEGNDKQSGVEYNSQRKRLNSLIQKLDESKIKTDNKIEIRVVRNKKSPTTTFFLTQKHNHQTSLLYVYPFIAGEKPMMSMEICDSVALSSMVRQFEDFWIDGDDESANKLNSVDVKGHAAD